MILGSGLTTKNKKRKQIVMITKKSETLEDLVDFIKIKHKHFFNNIPTIKFTRDGSFMKFAHFYNEKKEYKFRNYIFNLKNDKSYYVIGCSGSNEEVFERQRFNIYNKNISLRKLILFSNYIDDNC